MESWPLSRPPSLLRTRGDRSPTKRIRSCHLPTAPIPLRRARPQAERRNPSIELLRHDIRTYNWGKSLEVDSI